MDSSHKAASATTTGAPTLSPLGWRPSEAQTTINQVGIEVTAQNSPSRLLKVIGDQTTLVEATKNLNILDIDDLMDYMHYANLSDVLERQDNDTNQPQGPAQGITTSDIQNVYESTIATQPLVVAGRDHSQASQELDTTQIVAPDYSKAFWKVPPEIWTIIFEEYLALSQFWDEHGKQADPTHDEFDSLRLSAVCSLWREIMLSTSKFWTSISLNLAHDESRTLERVKTYVIRSHGFPIHLAVTTQEEPDLPIESLVPCFSGVSTLGTLSFNNYDENTADEMDKILHFLPPPEFIRGYSQIGLETRLTIPKRCASTVRKLRLRYIHFSFDEPLVNLTEHDFAFGHESVICQIGTDLVARLPNIERLVCDASLQWQEQLVPVGDIPQPPIPSTLHRLHTIVMDLESIIVLFVGQILLPSLRRIEITNGLAPHPSWWQLFIQENSNGETIEEFVIHDTLTDEEFMTVMAFLRHLKHVKNLKVIGLRTESVRFPWEADLSMEDEEEEEAQESSEDSAME